MCNTPTNSQENIKRIASDFLKFWSVLQLNLWGKIKASQFKKQKRLKRIWGP
jgi:hypothetical protein